MRGPYLATMPWDVIVIGAGPAGAVLAFCAARGGAKTLLVERRRFPRTKVCGGFLNAPAVAQLEAIGLGDVTARYGRPVDRLCVGMRRRQVHLELPGGVVVSRSRLDAALVSHAETAGAVFRPETRAVLGNDVGSAREVVLYGPSSECRVRGRAVVLASGLGGSVLGETGEFATRVARSSRIGAGCLVAEDERASDGYRAGEIAMAVGRRGYVGLTRTSEGLTVASATDAGFLKGQGGPARAAAAILEEVGFPPVPGLLQAEWSGTLPLTRTTRPLAASRVFLVGDAAGYVEPFTGQGMAIAVQGAAALWPHVARALSGWSPALAADWSRAYRKTFGAPGWPAALIASIARRPTVAALAFTLAEALPMVPDVLIRIVSRPTQPHPAT